MTQWVRATDRLYRLVSKHWGSIPRDGSEPQVLRFVIDATIPRSCKGAGDLNSFSCLHGRHFTDSAPQL